MGSRQRQFDAVDRSVNARSVGPGFRQHGLVQCLGSRAVIIGHACVTPWRMVLRLLASALPGCFGGAVIVETIFAWPGIGKFVLDSIFDRDYPVIQGFVVFMGTIFLLVNLFVDLGYAALDPRIRLEGR
jgi:peptide/nickel transport system permease protein